MTKQKRTSTATVFLIVFIVWLNIIGACYFSGIIPPLARYDADITEFGVCMNNTSYLPVESIPVSTARFYLCGIVEGTTKRSGTLLIFYNDTVVFQEGVELSLGFFALPIDAEQLDEFDIGVYRAEIGYARKILAQTTFEVIDG